MFVLLLYSILLSKTIHNFRAASTGIGAAPCLEGSDSYVSAGDCGEAVGCHEHCQGAGGHGPEGGPHGGRGLAGELVRGASGGAGRACGVRPPVRQVAAGGFAHPAGKLALHRRPGQARPVRHPADPAAPGGRVRGGERLRRWPGGGTDFPYRLPSGRMHQAHEAAVDFQHGGRGHPGGLRQPSPRQGL